MTFPSESPFTSDPGARPEIEIENLRPSTDPNAKELARRTTAIDHIVELFYSDLDDATKLDEIWDTVEEFA